MSAEEDSVYLIAEAGVNHNGDLARALAMIDAAAEAGADAVKFQTFVPQALASSSAGKAAYQRRNDATDEGQLAMLQRLALDFDAHLALLAHCRGHGIDFLSSPFDRQSAEFLLGPMQLKTVKLGSGELTNAPLLWQLARSDARLILSTGMATRDEVVEALGLCCLARRDIQPTSAQQCHAAYECDLLADRVALLHCTTEYPCPPDSVNLRAMDTLRELTGLAVGYSDHTRGLAVAVAAVARGARIIEKHFTLNRSLPGPDHAASLEVDELRQLADMVRTTSAALGQADKRPTGAELDNAAVARKSLVAAGPIRRGEPFDADNLTSKRPAGGLSPLHYWSLIGTKAARDYAVDEQIDREETRSE